MLGCYPPWPLQMWTNKKNCENKRSPFASMQTAAAGGECPLLQETHFIMIQETKKKDRNRERKQKEKKGEDRKKEGKIEEIKKGEIMQYTEEQ